MLDLTPLRVSRDYRLLWTGQFVSELGYQFARVAIYVQVFELTGSAAAVGLTGLTGLGGLLAGSLVGSSFIDARDRRSILMWSQVFLALAAAILLVGAVAGDPPLTLIYGANALTAFVGAIEHPARSAMTTRLVGTDLLPAALTLNQVLWQTVNIVGPAAAGVAISAFGFGAAYAIDLVTYAGLLIAATMMRPMPPEHDPGAAIGWAAVKEGLAFVRANRLVSSTFAIDLVAMVFGMPAALFPILAITQFHRGPAIVGLLFAAPSVGALAGALSGGWVRRVHRPGIAVIWAVAAWGAAIAAFGLVGSNLPLALAFLALAGAADVISAIFRSTIAQLATPDRLRGRLSTIFIVVVTGGPRLGDFEAGLMASWFTPTISVVTGGLACIAGAGVVALAYPELRRHRSAAGT
ncbi:MAG: MFS transporter [Actinobacteria bacterium]|nr:MFS transporter [Actinomycetota bacterium]